ncbi:ABC-ATPase domain-containing protein [Kocuria sp.]|uniref:ABC-ATPase domain-containing protein n=1 Tax=Kocuria sp. TaxID=1871328 RepID=UPI0026DEAAE2|nr:ABC-ATPase domain-containing protein [Kocuria sp.]MDO5618487.1 ABC-ATPase domain-containing protein [Kocuria sp.]
MRDLTALQQTLRDLDGQGYGSYKRLKGSYDMGGFTLSVDHTQVDPYAPPSKIRVLLTPEQIQLPTGWTRTRDQRIAAADYLARRFNDAVSGHQPRDSPNDSASRPQHRGRWGNASSSGDAHALKSYTHGQEVLERSSVVITDHRVEVRLEVALPAAGRRIKGRAASRILTESLPQVVAALAPENRDDDALAAHVRLYEDQLWLAQQLPARGLVAFVGDGAVLPRRSGDSQLPLQRGAVPFASPESLAVDFTLPSGNTVHGMGIPEGITVIVGGGYHGKSTLLAALSSGVYPHVAGDGREWVISRPDAVSIRAEDGRSVTGVDISPFITGLPTGVDTREFTTTNASGSTSQAANLVEALESGTSTVLIDEDTSATNFMIRDDRMKRLIPAHKEPITPFVERVKPMLENTGVSTVLVAGGSGAFFDVADHVIAMESYQPKNVTAQARQIATETPWGDEADSAELSPREVSPFRARTPRIIHTGSLNPPSKSKPNRARGRTEIQVGKELIDLNALAQLVDAGQTAAIAQALDDMAAGKQENIALQRAAQEVMATIRDRGLDALSPRDGHPGYLAAPRQQELQAVINRFRGLTLANGSRQRPAG